MSWNYRVLMSKDRNGDPWYAIHEVYYEDKDKPDDYDNVTMWTVEAVSFGGDTVDELKSAYSMAAEAFNKPVLDVEIMEANAKAKQVKSCHPQD